MVRARLFIGVLGALLSTSILSQAHAKHNPDTAQALCPDIVLVGGEHIDFTDSEKRLVCGDTKTPAWQHIPHTQAAFHLGVFLQDRGYFQPHVSTRDGVLIVDVGPFTTITAIEVIAPTPYLHLERKRKLKGYRLTPKRLSELQNWTTQQLRAAGFPCPEVASTANPHTGVITLEINTGPRQSIATIIEEPVEGLAPGVLRRYDAFTFDQPYNGDFLRLTAERIEQAGFLQNTYFSPECGKDGASVTEHVIAGPPRLIILGFGVNTEGLVTGKASWRHTRLGRLGSLIDVTALASYHTQQLNVLSEWYFLDPPARFHFEPLLSITQEYESDYHYLSANLRLSPAMTWDDASKQQKLVIGPDLSYIRTFKGAETGFKRFVSLDAQYQLISHTFEFYRPSPRTGYSMVVDTRFSHRDLLSDLSAQAFTLVGEQLWNVRRYDPPLLVLGVRGGLFTTLYNDAPERFSELPPNFLHYLGGSTTVRGFGRKEVPDRSRGALTAAFASVEARLAYVIPYGIQPFVFFDIGAIGDETLRPTLPLLASPGVGIRFESRIGPFRATAAHGVTYGEETAVTDDLTHWQFYFSFGEEF